MTLPHNSEVFQNWEKLDIEIIIVFKINSL